MVGTCFMLHQWKFSKLPVLQSTLQNLEWGMYIVALKKQFTSMSVKAVEKGKPTNQDG